jgi:DNA-binding NarL/FixJ family response regulator
MTITGTAPMIALERPMPEGDLPLRVLIADDHRVWTEGLALSLEDHGLQPVEIVHDGGEVIEACLKLRPDVVLLDIRLPGRDGLKLLADIRERLPDTTVMMLTGATDPTLPSRTYELGADGFLSKDTTSQTLANRIRSAYTARHSEEVEPSRQSEPAQVGSLVELTATEEQVLRLVAQGFDNAAIAENLTVSKNTVKTHVSNLLAKLDVPNRTLAAVWAIQHGYAE